MNAVSQTAAAFSSAMLFVALSMAPLDAQTIVGVTPSPSASPRPDNLSSQATALPPASNVASALSSGEPVFQRGPIGVRPHLLLRELYSNGIEAGPGNPRNSHIQSVAPGVLFDLGKYWRLDYTPTWTFYSNPAFRDTVDQTEALSGRVPYAHGMVGAAQSYESSYAMLVETGHQTHQKTYSMLVEGTYKLGLHTMLEMSVDRSARYANAVDDAPEWTTSDWVQWTSTNWLRYEFSPRFEAAAGLGLGYAQVGVGSDMRFTLPQAKIVWKPADKISVTAQAGEENRRFESGTRTRLRSPVVTAAATYQLLPTTRFSFDATRSVSASYFANDLTRNKGWSVGLEQRFVERLYLATTFASQNTQYVATGSAIPFQRDDRYRALNVRLTTVFLHRLSVAVLYQTGRNASDNAAYVFHSDQYGAELSLQF